jgi:hypothetical protein
MMRFLTLLVPLSLAAVAACADDKGDESKQMKKVSGTYALTSHDAMAARMLEGRTMTLRPDGRWVSTLPPDTAFRRPAMIDSGTYRIRENKVAIRSDGSFDTFVVRGDTLMADQVERERRVAQAEALTGVKVTGQIETFYVRVQQ